MSWPVRDYCEDARDNEEFFRNVIEMYQFVHAGLTIDEIYERYTLHPEGSRILDFSGSSEHIPIRLDAGQFLFAGEVGDSRKRVGFLDKFARLHNSKPMYLGEISRWEVGEKVNI